MDNISKVYEKLLSLKSTKLILDDGRGRKLYEVAISPAFRTKYFKYNSPQRVEGLELKTKSDITGNVYEKGWVLIDNRQQLKDRQPNPRPRKYASDAERQAAFRNRASMLEFRADEKTAEKLTEIADTLDISRSDLLLSMVKFALTNHQWARFGLTHKTLPRYEENPIMATKKFSPAQIAAQKLFAERARAGTLGKTVKRNPATKNNLPDYRKKTDEQLQFIMKDASEAARAMRGLDARAEAKYLDQINDASTVLYERATKPKYSAAAVNKAIASSRSKISASEGKTIHRLLKGRHGNPAGYFPNPYTMSKSKKKANFPFCVETKATENWSIKACFKTMQPAKEYAVALSKQYPNLTIRVMQYAGAM